MIPLQTFKLPLNLDDETRVKLLSCLDEVRNIVGESTGDQMIVDTLIQCNYDMTSALDKILNATSKAAETKSITKPANKTTTATGEYELFLCIPI